MANKLLVNIFGNLINGKHFTGYVDLCQNKYHYLYESQHGRFLFITLLYYMDITDYTLVRTHYCLSLHKLNLATQVARSY